MLKKIEKKRGENNCPSKLSEVLLPDESSSYFLFQASAN